MTKREEFDDAMEQMDAALEKLQTHTVATTNALHRLSVSEHALVEYLKTPEPKTVQQIVSILLPRFTDYDLLFESVQSNNDDGIELAMACKSAMNAMIGWLRK